MTKLYSKDHEWVHVEGTVATIGISHHAQGQLGDVVFVEVPDVGRDLKAGDQAAVVESVKAASEVYAPVAGKVIAVNDALTANPGLANEDAEGAGWFFRLQLADGADLSGLMDAAAYATFAGDH